MLLDEQCLNGLSGRKFEEAGEFEGRGRFFEISVAEGVVRLLTLRWVGSLALLHSSQLEGIRFLSSCLFALFLQSCKEVQYDGIR